MPHLLEVELSLIHIFIAHQAKLWLDGGSVFDKKSGQFERIVLACTKKTLLKALTQLEAACRGRNS